ncbi:HD-domain/PDEase-like protein [Anaeromyces robustus]|uniref:HD-domain/PDEase-like protein n=1 Tax=Anaeromyces robustus TaxID=1754192 RepID=A0A1Y1X056_9FUNG|nr:HD-domain/PDEase-like protein [Anaeromyces robustus]|eukprot:ORX79209.1 HD-domain/PDEase-like protein [Anaeromyces robustus]
MINKKEKIINDPVHGIIQLEEFAVDIINTRYFQRLHHVRQLDIAYLVYPGAMHTRFEHCIGTYYIARSLLESLNLQNSKYATIIKISALIHDIGHGPFSHQYDSAKVDGQCHEERASTIIQKLSEEITNPRTKKHFTPDNIELICRIINGNESFIQKKSDSNRKATESMNIYTSNEKGKEVKENANEKEEKEKEKEEKVKVYNNYNVFNNDDDSLNEDSLTDDGSVTNDGIPSYVFEIVSNHYNGIDVDRFDYIIRDSYYTGVCTSFNLQRILQVVELRNNHMVFPKKDFFTIFLFFQARYILHKLVYQHKTVGCYGKILRQIIKRHINQIRSLEWEDQTDEHLLFLMRATDSKFRKIKKLYPKYEEFKKQDINNILKECQFYLSPEQIKDLTSLTPKQYEEIDVVGADNILYRKPVYKVAKKIVLKRFDMESYHNLEEEGGSLSSKQFYKIRNEKPEKLSDKEIQKLINDPTNFLKAINEGLYTLSEPVDSNYEIKDEVSFGFGVPSKSFYNNILFFDKGGPDESSVKSYEELDESACLPAVWSEYSVNYYNRIEKTKNKYKRQRTE